MKNSHIKALAIALFMATLMIPLNFASAQPSDDLHILVNAQKLHADQVLPNGFHFVDDLIVQVKGEGTESSIAARGSLHGIVCQATFFLDSLSGQITGDVLTLTGTITDTNNPFENWIGRKVVLELNLSNGDMTVKLSSFVFTGTGKAIQN